MTPTLKKLQWFSFHCTQDMHDELMYRCGFDRTSYSREKFGLMQRNFREWLCNWTTESIIKIENTIIELYSEHHGHD